MKKSLSGLLCLVLLSVLLATPASAAIFRVSYYSEDVYAGGTMDFYAFPSEGDPGDYTYQWQVDLGIGSGSWSNLDENAQYEGVKTNHLQLHTRVGNYSDWNVIPFRCVVTHQDGSVAYTPNIYGDIYPTDNLFPALERWGYELYEPNMKNVTGLRTDDYVNYTASAYAGSNFEVVFGSKPLTDHAVLPNSDVKLTRYLEITEKGHTTKLEDMATYMPYTVGANAVTVTARLHVTLGQTDLGDLDTKTIRLNIAKPTVVATATAKSACSLLRYTYNESQKLASIPVGGSVEILSKVGSYYQVYYGGYVGYVGASLLNVSGYDPVIRELDVTVQAPVVGKTPDYNCQVITEGCKLYRTDPVMWLDADTGQYASRFEEGRRYKVVIWVAAEDGYKFPTDAAGNPNLKAAINGDLPPYIYRAYEQDPEKVVELVFTFRATAAHECVPVSVPRVEPTCTQPGKLEFYRCSCGKTYKDPDANEEITFDGWGILPATGHTPGQWQRSTEEHYAQCTGCNEMLDQGKHTGGTLTCTEKPKCEVCGFAYGTAEPDHKWSPTYLYQDKTGHGWICANCKDHSQPEPHKPGPEATDTKPQTCTDCGYIITPAKNHTHSLTRVPQVSATCMEPGTLEHYICSGCSDRFADTQGTTLAPEDLSVGALGHAASDDWKLDGLCHWRYCTRCGVTLEETKLLHSFAEDTCADCGYVMGAEVTAPTGPQTTEPTLSAEPTAPTEPGQTTLPGEDPGDFPWGWALACIGGALVLAVGITVLIMKKKRD